MHIFCVAVSLTDKKERRTNEKDIICIFKFCNAVYLSLCRRHICGGSREKVEYSVSI